MSVDLTVEGAVAKIVLNRPDKLNALNVEMRQSLCDYFARLRFDDSVRVVIVTGPGEGFCSGADVDRMAGSRTICVPTASVCSGAVIPLFARSIRSRSRDRRGGADRRSGSAGALRWLVTWWWPRKLRALNSSSLSTMP